MPLDAGFLSMLTMSATWQTNTGKDQWGNEAFSAPVAIKCFITSQTQEYGVDAGNNRQEDTTVTRMEILTDAIGVKLNDRLTIGGTILHVENVDTPKDELGVDLMHTVTASSTEKG